MTQQLYIKTDGPIPEGCGYITAGKVYPVLNLHGSLADIYVNRGHISTMKVRYEDGSGCAHIGPAAWQFCDLHGNPVPAPWEGPPSEPINWQAHAEALQAENARLRKDAERYRSLRIGDIDDIAVVRGLGAMDYGMSAVIGTYSEEIDGDVLDAAIDAAMKGGGV